MRNAISSRTKRARTPSNYRRFVREQLVKSTKGLEQKLGGQVDMLAWPFSIYDDEHIVFPVSTSWTEWRD